MDPDVFLTRLMYPDYHLTFSDFRDVRGVAEARMHVCALPEVCQEIVASLQNARRSLEHGFHYAPVPYMITEASTVNGERLRQHMMPVRGNRRISVPELKSALKDWWTKWIVEITDEGFLDYSDAHIATFYRFMKIKDR